MVPFNESFGQNDRKTKKNVASVEPKFLFTSGEQISCACMMMMTKTFGGLVVLVDGGAGGGTLCLLERNAV